MKDKLSWEETINYVRSIPEYCHLIEISYLNEKLQQNVESFRKSDEFLETLAYIKKYKPDAKTILDIGSGNGVSAVSFALEGYNVIAIEPYLSETVGAGAIEKLKKYYNLKNLQIFQVYAEELNLENDFFDLVYLRQCMHHAVDLEIFLKKIVRHLKKGGMFFSVRDHVIYNEKDKKFFLENHPLQKYYGGENAFTSYEYKNAISKSNLRLKKELKYFDSVINYFPLTKDIKEKNLLERKKNIKEKIKKKTGKLLNDLIIKIIIEMYLFSNIKPTYNEKKIYGRMYSYIAIKK